LSCRSDPPDMQFYFKGIRKSGMSERAYTTLEWIASARAGTVAPVCQRDPNTGAYQVIYISAYCMSPYANRDSVRAQDDRRGRLQDQELERLKKIADSDHSGFVSTPEALALQSLFELGWKFPKVLDDEHGDSTMIYFRMAMSPRELRETLGSYRQLSAKLVAEGGPPLTELPWK
jgi:hypothetical protein